tara:strand:- start:980 stop:1159 length:180 start_codon:yes stop_codon:yes gene_type:complete
MKISKKTKVAIITFIALGITGVAVLKIKKVIDKRRKKNQKSNKKGNQTMSQLLKLPDDV